MHAFTRVAAFIFFLLSLSFLVSALPSSPRTPDAISGVIGTDPVSITLAKFVVEIGAKVNALPIAIDVLVEVINGCANELLKVSAGVEVTVEAKASIVACICSIITLIAKVCAVVSVKFGLFVVLGRLAKIDVCVKLLLVNLNICIAGILSLILKG
ncbi:hypothetical protein FRC06_004205, partial [Ceratobasidium sp. 370]